MMIKQQKLEQLEQQQGLDNSNVLRNVATQESSSNGRTSEAYGFLNHQNSRLVMEARTNFRVVWGNRPLVDNWRRIETVRSSRQGSSTTGKHRASRKQQIPAGQ
ncbi:MAG: hypothetical protein U5K69_06230 [Balneolaceae bacterium]|nr:hypothetical protein [Balneolaceae bacterium]